MNNNVVETIKKEMCTGCGSCVASCPKKALCFIRDEKGFNYPVVNNDACTQCGLCIEKCHILSQDVLNNEVQEAYGFKHYVTGVRENSSSGGAFTALSDYILEHNGAVYGAVYSKDEIANVCHARAVTSEQRNAMRGSKYVQSECSLVFPKVKKDLMDGKMVLFTGTPCQVAGLKKYLGNKKNDNLLLCDIFCHSVLSPGLFNEHIKFLEKKSGKNIIGYSSREKRFGWSRRDCIYYADGSQEHSTMRSQLYYLLFNLQLANRPSCVNCLYAGQKRVGDFSIGDFLSVDHGFRDELGVSALLVNTDRGREVFSALKNTGWIQNQTVSKLFEHNHRKPIKSHSKTDEFWKDYIASGYKFVARKYLNYNFYGKSVFWLKKRLKRVKHLIGM